MRAPVNIDTSSQAVDERCGPQLPLYAYLMDQIGPLEPWINEEDWNTTPLWFHGIASLVKLSSADSRINLSEGI